MFSVKFFGVVSGSPHMRACGADIESVRKTAFLGFSPPPPPPQKKKKKKKKKISVAFSSARTSAL